MKRLEDDLELRREKERERKRQYRAANSEKVKAVRNTYLRRKRAEMSKEKLEELRKKGRERNAKWRADNPEQAREMSRRYKKTPQGIEQRRRLRAKYFAKRRAAYIALKELGIEI